MRICKSIYFQCNLRAAGCTFSIIWEKNFNVPDNPPVLFWCWQHNICIFLNLTSLNCCLYRMSVSEGFMGFLGTQHQPKTKLEQLWGVRGSQSKEKDVCLNVCKTEVCWGQIGNANMVANFLFPQIRLQASEFLFFLLTYHVVIVTCLTVRP